MLQRMHCFFQALWALHDQTQGSRILNSKQQHNAMDWKHYDRSGCSFITFQLPSNSLPLLHRETFQLSFNCLTYMDCYLQPPNSSPEFFPSSAPFRFRSVSSAVSRSLILAFSPSISSAIVYIHRCKLWVHRCLISIKSLLPFFTLWRFFSEQNGARQLLSKSTSLTREYFPAARHPILLLDWLSDFRANIQVHDAFIHFLCKVPDLIHRLIVRIL